MSLCLIIGNLLVKCVTRSLCCMYGVTWSNTVDHCLLSPSHSPGCWDDERPQPAIYISWYHLWTQRWYPGAVAPPPRGLEGCTTVTELVSVDWFCTVTCWFGRWVWCIMNLLHQRHHEWVCGGVIGCRQNFKGSAMSACMFDDFFGNQHLSMQQKERFVDFGFLFYYVCVELKMASLFSSGGSWLPFPLLYLSYFPPHLLPNPL